MLILTGSQRSGTSMVAHYCSLLGIEVGGAPWDSEVDGGHEHVYLCSWARDRLGLDDGFPFAEWTKQVAGVTPRHPRDCGIAKFSYLTMLPELVVPFCEEFSGARVILLLRSPHEVVLSKTKNPVRARRFADDHRLLHQTADVLALNILESVRLMSSRGVQVRVVPFPNFINEPDLLFDALFTWGGLPDTDQSREVWSSWCDPSKVGV